MGMGAEQNLANFPEMLILELDHLWSNQHKATLIFSDIYET